MVEVIKSLGYEVVFVDIETDSFGPCLKSLQEKLDAGASCLVSPVLGTEVGEVAAQRDVAWMPGIATPTEAYAAHQAGAPLQKIFPMPGIGAAWVKAIRGPMPFLNLVPTHGVHENNAASFLKAGAHAVGFVQSVFDPNDIAERRWHKIKERAEKALASVR